MSVQLPLALLRAAQDKPLVKHWFLEMAWVLLGGG